MSTLRVNNITDTSGGDTNLNVPNTAKAWVNFNGASTVAIRADFNVNTITDNGTGNYTVNFSNAMSDANYAAAHHVGDYNHGSASTTCVCARPITNGVSSYRIAVNYAAPEGHALWDYSMVCISIFR